MKHFQQISLFLLGISLALPARAECTFDQQLTVSAIEIGHLINWSTLTEQNNAYFIVQRSSDGINFENIGQIRGAGSSQGVLAYQYLDIRLSDTKTFYRLEQVDFDGFRRQTPIELVYRETPNQFVITGMSNTSTETIFSALLRTSDALKLNYSLENFQREPVQTGFFSLVSGANVISLNLTDYPEGNYRLSLEVDGEEETIILKKVAPASQPAVLYSLTE